MKRKTVAAVLALVLAMGMGTTSMAASTHTSHGTEAGAVVSNENSTMGNGQGQSLSGDTQFYINVDKDATGGEVVIPGTEDITGAGGICHYDVNWKYEKTTKLSVTVPLYVCMYGYGGDGKVVTPAKDAYKMTNNSTYTDKRTVEHIYACYQVVKIKSSDEYLATAQPGNKYEESYIKGIKDNTGLVLTDEQKSGQYGYYCVETAGGKTYKVVKLSDCDTHDENSACTNKTDDEYKYFYRDITTDVTVPASQTGSTDLKVDDIQYAKDGAANNAALKIEVPTIKAELHTWKLRSANEASSLKAGEIAMTLKGLDLSKVAASENNTMDIKDLNWAVDGNGGTLPLPINAAIAGGSVNEEGCVPVVRVTYTVSPAEDAVTGGTYAAQP